MTFEEKAGIVISQLRADRDRLLDALDKIRTEIEALEYLNIEDGSDGYDKYIEQYEVLNIIDKYRAEEEDCSYEDLINDLEQW